ncbi:phosphoglycerate kinase [Salinibacter ruber]|jgi:phosphoglycerate kinase|uniref:Phosphoglycerate kinase n=3 Tax=Salinibacter ruber TaxID=146919 RepID=PGK_SALRD|nr:phosphoglycerate kinase [Salinibacter ruber]Q2S3A7.1 RecName: Full=Phosphoglycerate kinase [Salinibacter ruber DSM 13855]ABC45859.1 phosphoglycerate kinase [Salinibacter ruber DSM 13855]MBB4060730.1 phosphoglycerate kinase [Salinibacter ruber]MBB4068768.1 phosphoglycerate kinase [Salinibacter ruber]MCS3634637.1 phosphoglycerate kinase [Salinibacter ruber]MCS3636852.1 phosphoglycerate kinase [Salinibacter ruber]
MHKLTLDDVDVRGQRVLIRVDFNVPLDTSEDGSPCVGDDTRIRAALPTIRHVLDHGGKAILVSHLGRPGGQPDPDLSLACVADHLGTLIEERVRFSSNTVGDTVEEVINGMSEGSVILLENTRFDAGEKANDEAFATALANLADVYVNDAFGAAHRAHASTAGVAEFMDVAALGRLMEDEIEALTRVRDDPAHPMVAILGGSKVSDKLGTIRALSETADHLLIGGAMSYTFLKVLGHEVGASRVEADRLDTAEDLYEQAEGTITLPTDHVVAEAPEADATASVVEGDIPAELMGLDIGPATIDAYRDRILGAATVVWNGPMGVFEVDPFADGTTAIAEAMADATDDGAFSVVGGGDSVSALTRSGCDDRISHVSTGGGALLTFLEGAPLPGVEALTDA